jgi:hypothetical protein
MKKKEVKDMAKGRGLASASAETRSRVASAGGRASHGGGRPKSKGRKGGRMKLAM